MRQSFVATESSGSLALFAQIVASGDLLEPRLPKPCFAMLLTAARRRHRELWLGTAMFVLAAAAVRTAADLNIRRRSIRSMDALWRDLRQLAAAQ